MSRSLAAHLLEAAEEDLTIEAGEISVRGSPAASISLRELAHAAYHNANVVPPDTEPGLETTARFAADGTTFANATHACICEVDHASFRVRILRYVVASDCGVVINPGIVEGQIAGGVVQGLGGVLLEHFVYDKSGNPLCTTFMDYLLPTATEVPRIEFVHRQTPASGLGGYKGVGEGGAIASPAAIINAVADALQLDLLAQPLDPSSLFERYEAAHRYRSSGAQRTESADCQDP